MVSPDNPGARELFDRVGGVLVPSEEETFEAFSAATATFAAHLDYLTAIVGWSPTTAWSTTPLAPTPRTSSVRLGQSLLQHADSLTTLSEKHRTPGGNNEQFMTDLRHDGVPDVVRSALDRILTRLREQD